MQATNDELHDRVQELDVANSDLQHHYAGTNIATIFVDRDLRITRFTPAANKLFNVRRGDVGRPLRDLSPGFVEEDLLESVGTVLAAETGMERHVHRSEGPTSFLVRILPYRTQDKAVGGVGITFVDITDLVRERENTRATDQARERIQGLVEATTHVVSESARSWAGLLQAAADAARELTSARLAVVGHGQTDGQFTIEACSRAADAADYPPTGSFQMKKGGILTELAGGRDTLRLTDQEMRAHPEWWGRPEGHVPMRGILGVRLVARDGTTNGVIVATDRMEGKFTLEDEVLLKQLGVIASLAMHNVQTRMQLEEADHNRNQFLAALSHELRSPLAPIKNGLHVLGRAAPGGDLARQAHTIVERQVDHLVRLVDDLLDVTRVTRNKIHLRLHRLELNDLVRGVVEDHHTLFEEREIHLEVDPASEPVFIDGDSSRIAQILGNLLQNAAKFTHRGGRVSVSLSREPAASRAVLRVIDSGIGMEAETLVSLFQPFMQAERSLSRSQGGLGLGLALVKGLVELHGGEVTAASAGAGKGAEMIVRLPLATSEAAVPPATVRSAPHVARRVLVIEDNADAATSLKLLLTIEGHKVETAPDGPAGLAVAVSFRPEVLLCDIGLPGMDGYEVARAFRSNPVLAGTFLVALTGYGLPEDVRRTSEAGFDRHVTKPPSFEQLERLLASVPGPAPDTVSSG